MIKFMSLSSGSCGNCYYLGTENCGILIDAGVSLRRLKKVLQEYNLTTDSFSAVLVTHDHLDHIRHLGSFCKRLNKLLRPFIGLWHVIPLLRRPSDLAAESSLRGSGMRLPV